MKLKSWLVVGNGVLDDGDAALLLVRERAGDGLSGATSMFETGLPSSQVAELWSQPLGTDSESE